MNYIIFALTLILIAVMLMILKSLRIPMSIRKAEELFTENDLNGANELVKFVLNKKRNYVPAMYLKARILMQRGQYLLAIHELNEMMALSDFKKFVNELEVHYHLASLYNQTQNYVKEIDEYKAILEFNPDDIKANHRLGHAWYQQKNYKNARENFLKVAVLDPRIDDIFLPLGVSCFKTSDYQKAEAFLLKASELKKDLPEVQFYLGSIYMMKKDYDNASAMLDNAKNDKRFFVKSLYMLGEMSVDRDNYTEAIEYLEKGLTSLKDKDDESHAYRYLLAECYEHENKINEAIHHWAKIEADNPSFRSTGVKLEAYRAILENDNLTPFFQSSLEELQPYITDMISSLNYNIVSSEKKSVNEYQYRVYNIKRINDPPVLVYFNRTTREISEGQIIEFQKVIAAEKCKSGIYISTSKFSLRAKSSAASKMIDLYDSEYISKSVEKIRARKKMNS